MPLPQGEEGMKKHKKRQAVVAVIKKNDKFLFIQRSGKVHSAQGYWCPVSGKIEDNETQEEALKREVREEVGLDIVATKKVCVIPSRNKQFLLHFWEAEIVSGEAYIASDEITDVTWVTIAEMKKLYPVFEEDIAVFETL